MTVGQEAWVEFASEQFAQDCGKLATTLLTEGVRPIVVRETIERIQNEWFVPCLRADMVALEARLACF